MALIETKIAEQIETYSNAIIAFIVLQGLAYSYAFGTNEFFNCLVRNQDDLAETLTFMFILVGALSIYATRYLGRKITELLPGSSDTIKSITTGKIVIVVIFGFLPAGLTLFYGVLSVAGIPVYVLNPDNRKVIL